MKSGIEHIWQIEQLRLPALACQPPEDILSCGLSCICILQQTCTSSVFWLGTSIDMHLRVLNGMPC